MTEPEGCHVCEMRDAAREEQVVVRGDNWTVLSVQMVPGHLMVMSTAHDTGLANLTPSAASDFGPLLQQLSAGLIEDQQFDRTALLYLGENARHTHMLLIGRGAEDMPLVDTRPLRARIGALTDAGRSQAIIARLRAKMAPSGSANVQSSGHGASQST